MLACDVTSSRVLRNASRVEACNLVMLESLHRALDPLLRGGPHSGIREIARRMYDDVCVRVFAHFTSLIHFS